MNEKNLLLVVDAQNDFLFESGALYVPGARDIRYEIIRAQTIAADRGWSVWFTADDHLETDAEITLGEADPAAGLFNPHCMRGTWGAGLLDRGSDTTRMDMVVPFHAFLDTSRPLKRALFLKNTFDISTNPNFGWALSQHSFDNIYVCGVATDICVKAAVLSLLNGQKLKYVKGDIILVEDAIAGIDPEATNEFLTHARSEGVKSITTAELGSL